MHQSTAPWYLLNSSIKEVGYINVALGYLQLEATSEKLSKEKTLLDCWDRSQIQGFGNAHGIKIIAKFGGMTQ